MPTLGPDGCRRLRGRRHRKRRTSRYQVEREAKTFPSRCANTASVPVGTWRYCSDVTISWIAVHSPGVSCRGAERGHGDRSPSPQGGSCFQAW